MPISPGLLAQGLLELARIIFTPGGPASFREAAAAFVRMGGDQGTALRQVREAVQATFQLKNELRANGTAIVPETAYIPFPGRMAEGNNYMLNVYIEPVNTTTGEIMEAHPYTLTSSRPLSAEEWNTEIENMTAQLLTDSELELRNREVMGAFRKAGA